jgi:hypothetical protein
MRRTYEYAAMTKDECNAADGRFTTASWYSAEGIFPFYHANPSYQNGLPIVHHLYYNGFHHLIEGRFV